MSLNDRQGYCQSEQPLFFTSDIKDEICDDYKYKGFYDALGLPGE